MRQPPEHQPTPQLQALEGWDVSDDVGALRRSLGGLLVTGPHEHPFDHAIAHPCADPDCPYRVASVRPFESLSELFSAHVVRPARECGMSATGYFHALKVRVWRMRSRGRLRVAELGTASIADRVPLTAPDLDAASLDSSSCEVVRTVCDRLRVDAIDLPVQSEELGKNLLLHRRAWDAVDLELLGTLQDVVPLIGPGDGA